MQEYLKPVEDRELQVTDEEGYARYRAGMRPILAGYGGSFRWDIRGGEVLDKSAFADEEARVMQAVSTEGPMFLSVGRVKLIVLPTEGDLPIPESAEDAYACLPERVFLDERPGTAGHRERRADAMLPRIRGPGATLVRSKLGPLAAAGDLILLFLGLELMKNGFVMSM